MKIGDGAPLSFWAEDYTAEDEPIVGRVRTDPSYYPFMLIQDVQDRLLPYSRRTKSVLFVSSPSNDNVDAAILDSLDRSGKHSDTEWVVAEFLRMAVFSVVLEGRAIYGLRSREDKTRPLGRAWTFVPVSSKTVFVRRGQWFQYVPASAQREHSLPAYFPLDPTKLFIFTPPKSYDLASLVQTLDDLKLPGPTLFSEKGGYSWTEHRTLQNEAFLEATRQIGWMARGLHSTDLTAVYQALRWLRFVEFIARLRDEMIGTLNAMANAIAQQFSATVLIELRRIVRVDEVLDARRDLCDGKASIKDILKKVDVG